MSGPSHLVAMVCDIARFFASEADSAQAVKGIVQHIENFWNPQMRRKLIAGFPAIKDELPPVVRAAIEQLAMKPPLLR